MRKFKLTKEKATWGKARENAVIKGKTLNYNAGASAAYVASIKKLVMPMISEVEQRVKSFFEKGFVEDFFDDQEDAVVMDASVASQARMLLRKLSLKFNPRFSKFGKKKAKRMIKDVSKLSENNVQESLQTLSGGVMLKTNILTGALKEVTTAVVNENVSLIKSIARDYLHRVSGQVMRSIATGNGLQDLVPALKQYKGITERQATNIALDQTRKAYSSINKERMVAANIKEFEWIHSGGGQHPRKDHQAMSGKVYSFDELPIIDKRTGERGIPGQAINCRCTMRPIFSFENRDVEKVTL